MNDSLKTLLAFIGGAAAGLAVGILIAPDKGSETRRKLLSRAKDLTSDLSEAAKEKYSDLLNWKEDLVEGMDNNVKSYNKHENTVNNVNPIT